MLLLLAIAEDYSVRNVLLPFNTIDYFTSHLTVVMFNQLIRSFQLRFTSKALYVPSLDCQTFSETNEPSSIFAVPAPLRKLKLSATAFLIMVIAYLLPGLIGHDPWKQDETYIFGIIQHLLKSGDWIVPTVAGEPFMEKPPLYYWVAAGLSWLFSPWLPLHDGARLATGFFMAITCISIGWTARQWWGHGQGRFAVLALLGCFGIVWYGHLMLTDIPILTGFAISACGFTLARTRALTAGLLLAIGVGVGFLAKGLLTPCVIGLTAVLLPICFKDWRHRIYFRTLMVALLAVLPWLLIWPIALYRRSPSLFMDWFWLNNIGRFIGFSVPTLGAPHKKGFWLQTLPWFAFPAWPLTMLTLWRKRHTVFSEMSTQISLLMFVILTTVLWLSASARPNYALPLLVPVCLLAAPAVATLPSRVDRFWDWSSRALFGALAVIIWSIWIWMKVWGPLPADWTLLGRYLPLDFRPPSDFDDTVVAPILTFLALTTVWHLPKVRGRGMISWVIGMLLCWGLLSTLWLEWIDYVKSYRSVFQSMQTSMPYKHRCIASSGLGESERAMLHYVLGVNTQRKEIDPQSNCDLLLVNGTVKSPPHDIDLKLWKLVWEGARPCDLRERFWLFSSIRTSVSN